VEILADVSYKRLSLPLIVRSDDRLVICPEGGNVFNI